MSPGFENILDIGLHASEDWCDSADLQIKPVPGVLDIWPVSVIKCFEARPLGFPSP
jgi:hypothetical protein